MTTLSLNHRLSTWDDSESDQLSFGGKLAIAFFMMAVVAVFASIVSSGPAQITESKEVPAAVHSELNFD